MAVRLFLSSDLHLGMKFAGYPETLQKRLQETRFECLERIVAAANRETADLLVIAGDLFERVKAPSRDVQRAAAVLREFQGKLAAVMPGNHDFLAPGDVLWATFRDACGSDVLILDEPRPYPLARHDVDACLYPGPCSSKHSDTNAIGWVGQAAKDPGTRHHIGVAHGSLEGFSPDMDGRYYPMTARELRDSGVHLWLLGHTHVRFPESPGARDRVFCAGTPEPDGFDCAHEGSAWLLDLDDQNVVKARAVSTGSLVFRDQTLQVRTPADLAQIERAFSGADAQRTLLRLRLQGRLSREARESIGALRGRMAAKLVHLDLRTDELREEITRESIDRDYPAGSFPHSLLARLAEEGDADALEAGSDLLQEMRG